MPAYSSVMKSLRLAGILAAAVLSFNLSLPAAEAGGHQSTSAAATPAPKVEDQAAFSIIGMSVVTSASKEAAGDGEIRKLWQRVIQEGLLESIPSQAGGGPVAVYSDFVKGDTSQYTYTLGMRVSSTAKVPDGFVAITIPAGKYAVVPTDQGALPDTLPKAWKGIFAMTPTELGGERAYRVDYEEYAENMDWQNTQVNIHLGLK